MLCYFNLFNFQKFNNEDVLCTELFGFIASNGVELELSFDNKQLDDAMLLNFVF